jgi:hypothetical protein
MSLALSPHFRNAKKRHESPLGAAQANLCPHNIRSIYTEKALVSLGKHGGEQRTPLKGCVRVRSPYTAEQCSPVFVFA